MRLIAPLLLLAGCIQSVCSQDEECTDGFVCNEEIGECVEPECTQHAQCPDGEYCDDRFCEEGCVDTDDCGDEEQCYNHACIPADPECDIPGLPFEAEDLNPYSATVGQTLSFPSSTGAAHFFGYLSCGSCRVHFGDLDELRDELEMEGYHPLLAFVQGANVVVDAEYVGDKLEEDMDSPVVQDTLDLGITDYYGAEKYDIVLLDGQGCMVKHVGFSATEWDATQREEVAEAWRQAMGGGD